MKRHEFKEIHCPFLRTVLSAPDAPAWDAAAHQMKVADLLGFVRAQPGNGSLDRVLKFFAVTSHGLGNRGQRLFDLLGESSSFSTRLPGSDGDHGGDSRIYDPESREFDPEQFRRFTSFSHDGKTMTVADFGAAIVDANRRHNGKPSDAMFSAVEFGLLATLLGDETGTVAIADMRLLYEQNEFPAGARENLGGRSSQHWLTLTHRIGEAVTAVAAKTGHHASALGSGELQGGLRLLFGPLLP